MKYILQIHTGSWHDAHDRPEDIIRKIRSISSKIPVGKVIIGWNTDASVYQKVGAFLREAGIRMFLWLPVFSEVSKIAETDEALDIFGNRILPPAAQEGEGFVFDCPSSRRNIRAVKDIYEKFFSGCGFDGVFLDRIRTQSFLADVSGVLSCGCGRCRKAFLEKGTDLDEIRNAYELKKDSFFDMAEYPPDGQFRLEDEAAQRFFEAKEGIIADAVTDLCRHFKGKGLTVGLDLFAPAVSRFVGQNYPMITKEADFIKPMLYRRTEAPAGIGYEYALFEKHAPGARGRWKLPPDEELLETQLEAAGHAACKTYPGIEVNYHAELVRTDPGYIRESLAAVRNHGFEGAVLCWNVMQAPDAHTEAAVQDPAALFAERSAEILGANLVGVYLHGSAAMGCYNPAKSDLDLIVVVEDTPDDACKRAFMDMTAEISARLPGRDTEHAGIEMSIVRRAACSPFVYPTPFELHFSAMHLEWYRRDPEDYIRKMKGTDKDLAAHFTVIRHRGRCLAGKPAEEVFGEVPAEDYLDSIYDDIRNAGEKIAGNPMYCTLNLARTLAYRTDGKILSKKEGGEWGLAHLPEKYSPLLRTALEDYENSGDVLYDLENAKEYAGYMLGRIKEDR